MFDELINDIVDWWRMVIGFFFSRAFWGGLWNGIVGTFDNAFILAGILLLILTSPFWVGPFIFIRHLRRHRKS